MDKMTVNYNQQLLASLIGNSRLSDHPFISILSFVVVTTVLAIVLKWWADRD
jgi:hypothetical protein